VDILFDKQIIFDKEKDFLLKIWYRKMVLDSTFEWQLTRCERFGYFEAVTVSLLFSKQQNASWFLKHLTSTLLSWEYCGLHRSTHRNSKQLHDDFYTCCERGLCILGLDMLLTQPVIYMSGMTFIAFTN